MRLHQRCVFVALWGLLATGQVSEADIVTSDFQDGTVQGWIETFTPGTSALADAGPGGVGDFALQAIPHPVRLKLHPHNLSTPGFVGDLLAAGVGAVRFDAMNPTSSVDSLQLRAVFMNGIFNRWVSNEFAALPHDGQWRTFELSLRAADVVQAQGSSNYADDLASVTLFGLRHQLVAGDRGGTQLSSPNNSVRLDNITLLRRITGDFDNNGVYDCTDIDLLVGEIAAGLNNSLFDLTGDGLVDLGDRDAWLTEAGSVNLDSGNAYLLGDASLDGFVDTSDFNDWNANKFTSIAAWCSGDFNADGAVDTLDFNIWNANKFTSANALVPEPASLLLCAAGCVLFLKRSSWQFAHTHEKSGREPL